MSSYIISKYIVKLLSTKAIMLYYMEVNDFSYEINLLNDFVADIELSVLRASNDHEDKTDRGYTD